MEEYVIVGMKNIYARDTVKMMVMVTSITITKQQWH